MQGARQWIICSRAEYCSNIADEILDAAINTKQTFSYWQLKEMKQIYTVIFNVFWTLKRL